MAEVIEMPKLSDTMEEGAIASWLKKEGEFVGEGEALVEIETDKATMEYNSPEEGYLLKIIVEAGESCELNAPIAILGEKGESVDLAKLTSTTVPAVSVETASATEDGGNVKSQKLESKSTAQSEASDERLRSSPLARKLAHERGLDLASIQGSGPGGRIVLKDVEQFASQQAIVDSAPAASHLQNTQDTTGAVESANMEPLQAGYQDIPHSMMRKTIAKRLLVAKNEAPHFYLTISADMAKLLSWRKQLNAGLSADASNVEWQVKVSVNDLVILAVSRALLKHPEVNASWAEQYIRRYQSVDISVAVAVPDGLITPVIRGAEKMGARDIARVSKELVQKAKNNQLEPAEYQGGSFSISNLGMMGIESFTAIINPPQSAILAVGAVVPTPVVNQQGDMVVEQRMKMTMSCDHRVIDGAVGAKFLASLKSYLEDPLAMLT